MTDHLTTTRQPAQAARPRMGIRASARCDRRSRALWEGFRYAVGVGGAVVPTGILLKEGET